MTRPAGARGLAPGWYPDGRGGVHYWTGQAWLSVADICAQAGWTRPRSQVSWRTQRRRTRRLLDRVGDALERLSLSGAAIAAGWLILGVSLTFTIVQLAGGAW